MNKKIPTREYKGKGNSIWGPSKGTYHVNAISIGYVNWISYPKDDANIHASVTLSGPDTEAHQYTDTGLEKALSKDIELMGTIWAMLTTMLKAKGITKPVPAIYLNWSEWGMQPEKGWNFDVCPKKNGLTTKNRALLYKYENA